MGEELVILGVLFLIAWGLGRLGKLIGLPAIPIYMVVGLLASPHTGWFPLNYEAADVELVAIFGLILLLFNLGLEFDQDEFFGNARTLIVSGGTRLVINLATSFAFAWLLGWGTREAIVITGMMATSSSAIITKLLIELRRLANRETPTILGIAVIEDVFVAIYLSIVSVVVGGKTDVWPVVLELTISFAFLIAMFAIARWGGRIVSRVFDTRDDELFTIMFFGLAVAFGGIGELIGVSDAIGAFLIGLVLGASRFRNRVEQLALPMRDVFAAFFFLNFGLALDVSTFGAVVVPVAVAIVLTLVVNTLGGQLIAWQSGLTRAEGFNVSAMLQTRGEFALILATLAVGAGLDNRLAPFAGLYVLMMAIIGPVLAVNSERAGQRLFRPRAVPVPAAVAAEEGERRRIEDENIALVEAALAGESVPAEEGDENDEEPPPPPSGIDPLVEQAMAQSDSGEGAAESPRQRDPEY
ncbi:cation:proton antiporter [Galbitalea sp. SE-J8]|uniref:cation:proton antiporter n=1 Tax=Galbitalea sp. SE-J8 TaxID=3054952 RepID=UPI00259D195A|nr:cation:proton antiporter [Galbitalea sp. SE-J8]MDM4761431.1 cation:proton antiporter [Galbitalea sp. SE-J8]